MVKYFQIKIKDVDFLRVGIITCLLSGCIEPFPINPIDYDNLLVVDGRFTDEMRIHKIRLSTTRPIDEAKAPPMTGAEVWIESSEGEKITFEEIESGVYATDSCASGRAGLGYRLFFITNEGQHYASFEQVLVSSPPIDSIYQEYAEVIVETSEQMRPGIQFFLDSKDESSGAEYFRYDWEETYEVQAIFASLYRFFSEPRDTVIFREDEDVRKCYVTTKSSSFELKTTVNLTQNGVKAMPIRYMTNKTPELRYHYSLMVEQHAVSAEAYSYYTEFVKMNEETGSLFDQQLGTLIGNIRSLDVPEEEVLGFFEVSGMSRKRVFFEFDDLDPRFPWPDDPLLCGADDVVGISDPRQPLPYVSPDSLYYYARIRGFGVISADYCIDQDPIPLGAMPCPYYFGASLAPIRCTDCRIRGSIIKPDYWIYE